MARKDRRGESNQAVVMVAIRPGPPTPASTAAWRRFWTALLAQMDSPKSQETPTRTCGDQVLVANNRQRKQRAPVTNHRSIGAVDEDVNQQAEELNEALRSGN